MKIKFSILTALFCVFAVSAWAQEHETTTDQVTFSEITLNPGDYGKVTVSLENSAAYTAFGLDIYLPAGYEFYSYYDEAEEENIMVEKGSSLKSSHSIGYEIQKDGCLRVTSHSESSQTFKSGSHDLFSFYIKASSFAKPGTVVFEVKNCFYTSDSAVQYDTEDESINGTTTTNATLPVTITAENKWSTCVFPFASAIPAGLKVYSCSKEDAQYAYLTIENEIKAYTPYILYAANGYTNATWTGTAIASDYPTKDNCPAGLLVGAYTTIKTTSGYVLQNKGDGVKLYQIAADKPITIPAGKCYFESQINSSANLALSFEDETDGINAINGAANADAIYDLQGRKVEHPQKNGIYIVNGKTVIKK